jgi:hypothetical protein
MLVIAGVQKAGTSLLFKLLSRHPRITGCRFKEPHFFAMHQRTVDEHLDWYADLYETDPSSAPTSVGLEASTSYFLSERAIDRLDRVAHELRVVVVTRDPAARFFSGFLQNTKHVPPREYRSIGEVLDALERAFEERECLADAEQLAIDRAIDRREVDPRGLSVDKLARIYDPPFDPELEDPLFAYRYLEQSCYEPRTRRLRATLGDRLLVCRFEDLIASADDVIARVLEFAGLDTLELTESGKLPRENATRMPRGGVGRLLIEARRKLPGADTLVSVLGKLGVRQKVSESLVRKDKPELSSVQRRRIESLLQVCRE